MMKLIYARLVRRVFLTFALLALLLLLGTQALPASAASPSFVRLLNASPDVGTVDVFVDGAKFLGNTRFATVTDYLQLPAGHHNVQVALIGKGIGASVITQRLSVQPGTAYTVAAIGTKATGFSLQVFVDNNLMAVGMAKVRVYHLSPGTGPVSIATSGLTIPGALSYMQASNYMKLPARTYTFTVSASRPSFSLLDQVTLKTNTVTSIFIVGVFHGSPPLLFVHVQVKGLPSMSGTGSDPNALPTNASPFTPLVIGSAHFGRNECRDAHSPLAFQTSKGHEPSSSAVLDCAHCNGSRGPQCGWTVARSSHGKSGSSTVRALAHSRYRGQCFYRVSRSSTRWHDGNTSSASLERCRLVQFGPAPRRTGQRSDCRTPGSPRWKSCGVLASARPPRWRQRAGRC